MLTIKAKQYGTIRSKSGYAVKLIDDKSAGIIDSLRVAGGELKFSSDGSKLFFNVYVNEIADTGRASMASVNIWNYKDIRLQSEQLVPKWWGAQRAYQAVIHLSNNKIIRLSKMAIIELISPHLNTGADFNYMLALKEVNYSEASRLVSERPDVYLISTVDGSRTCIKRQPYPMLQVRFSPAGRYIYWYDPVKAAYFTYNLKTAITKNISHSVSALLYSEQDEFVSTSSLSYGSALWIQGDDALLVYDRFDIWKLIQKG